MTLQTKSIHLLPDQEAQVGPALLQMPHYFHTNKISTKRTSHFAQTPARQFSAFVFLISQVSLQTVQTFPRLVVTTLVN